MSGRGKGGEINDIVLDITGFICAFFSNVSASLLVLGIVAPFHDISLKSFSVMAVRVCLPSRGLFSSLLSFED